MKRIILSAAILLTAAFTLTSCRQTDIVGNTSISSFQKVLDEIPQKVSIDSTNYGWSLSAPDDSARFFFSRDYSKSPIHDVMLEFNAEPFIKAGLDINKLPAGMVYDGKIMVGTQISDKAVTYQGDVTPIKSYEKLVEYNRQNIKYHEALGHFGVDIGGGNIFEWAKDMSKTDKDIVFVLNPKVFTDAGADPTKIDGFVYAEVPVMDENGRKIKVKKLLKPFDLK